MGLHTKRTSPLTTALTLAMGSTGGVAPAAITDGPAAGKPDLNGSGKCSPGQNKDTSTGGLKKCP
jgi:hypothetical protein